MRTVQNERLLIEVSDTGAELKRLYDKKHGRELLYDGDPKWWASTSPLLFPIVGRLNEDKHIFGGKAYTMPMHGFVRRMETTCVQCGGDAIVHRITATDDTRAMYPYDFELLVIHKLEGGALRFGWRVTNRNDAVMPFSIGGHPAFRAPLNAGEGIDDVRLVFDASAPLRYYFIDKEHHLTPDERWLTPDAQGMVPLNSHSFDNDAYIFMNHTVRRVALAGRDGKPYLRADFEGFPCVGIWAKPGGAPYVCIEPWFGSDEPAGPPAPLTEKPGIVKLEAGQVFEASYTVEAL